MNIFSTWVRRALVAGLMAAAAFVAVPSGALAQPAITLTPLGTGGVVSAPLHAASPNDGSGRIFVVSQEGVIKIFQGGAYLSTPFLDISSLVTFNDEQGLLSMEFHPDYVDNGWFYVYYVDNLTTPGSVTIARYTVSSDPNVADPSSAQIVLVVPNPFDDTHRGGRLEFGPDGYLYAGIGDSGGVGDPENRAQNTSSLFGKLLRLDVNGTGAVPCGQADPMPYAVPPTNPFVGVAGACEEIWAYGFRNPWRFSFDRATDDLFIADVGEDSWEEIDLQPAGSTGGQNYGWRLMEADHCFDPPTNCDDGTLTHPIFEYAHIPAGRCAVIGGFRYRGTLVPDLVGMYVYGDLCSGEVFAATQSGGTWSSVVLKDTTFVISGFGEDEAGELYLTNLSGLVYRVEQTPYPAPALSAVSPSPILAGDPGVTLVATGSGFTAESVVRWNGSTRPTVFVSTSELHAAISAADIASIGTADVSVFTPAPGGGTSAVVVATIDLPFLDVPPGAFARAEIGAVFNAGVTAGCGLHVYCPTSAVTRAQMAVFLLKASLGSSYTPPPATGGVFADVGASDFAAAWIEDLYARGVTGGCATNPLRYCPDSSVTRAQMAVFLLKAEHGSSYTPPACTGEFGDVACPSLFADWIEQLAAEGVTAGCGNGNYCPESPVNRAQMAVFLTKTFNLPIP